MEWWQSLYLELTAFLGIALTLVTIPWVLMTKKETTSAVAWCLLVFFLPIFGSLLFLVFGYQHVHRPLKRKRRHKTSFWKANPLPREETAPVPVLAGEPDATWTGMARLAQRFGAFPVTLGNQIRFYHEGKPAFDAMVEAIRCAQQHVHLEYFIIQPDDTGQMLLKLLEQKARQGVEVRLLYDAMGSRHLHRRMLKPLQAAGGKCSPFLPLNPLRRRIQINMRDHRKILVVDGRIAFTGGRNIGDEYLGKSERCGHWRDTQIQIEGPAVAALQRVFIEGWDFAAEENLQGDKYFSPPNSAGPFPVQVVASGPDQEYKSIREMYFALILRAKKRVWFASPYFVPDAGLLDAISMAGYLGLDVRLLCQFHPDKWIPLFAARYYWSHILDAGVKVYQYTKGMMHSKVVLVDGEFASVGTANLDNRSLHLNFEVNCMIYSPAAVTELEAAFVRDLTHAVRLEREVFRERPAPGRLVENACRLLSPIL